MEAKKIRTAKGAEFPLEWDGVSMIDGALRLSFREVDADTLHTAFRDPEATKTLTRIWDGQESTYTGFSRYLGFNVMPNGETVVVLGPEV